MKKLVIYKLFELSLILYLLLHVLTLVGVISPTMLWDNTLNDTKTMICAEIIFIILYSVFIYKFYRRLRNLTPENKMSAQKLLRLFILFFFLELIGSLVGVETTYKFFGTYFYLFELLASLYILFDVSRLTEA